MAKVEAPRPIQKRRLPELEQLRQRWTGEGGDKRGYEKKYSSHNKGGRQRDQIGEDPWNEGDPWDSWKNWGKGAADAKRRERQDAAEQEESEGAQEAAGHAGEGEGGDAGAAAAGREQGREEDEERA